MKPTVEQSMEVMGQLAWCANELLAAIETGDGIAYHYTHQGLEFELMRAFWLLEDRERAQRIHRRVGDHAPTKCPVCRGEEAFA